MTPEQTVLEFIQAMGQDTLSPEESLSLSRRLIAEEAAEVEEAIDALKLSHYSFPDRRAALLEELVDLRYVLAWAIVANGFAEEFASLTDTETQMVEIVLSHFDGTRPWIEKSADRLDRSYEQGRKALLNNLFAMTFVLESSVDQLGFGVVFDEAFRRKHVANMSKLVDGKPLKDENGKVLKGPNYKPAFFGDLVE